MNQVTISPSRMDLGKIDGSKPMEFWFEVSNNSGRLLDLTTWASCGCSVSSIVPSRVEAGAKAKLRVAFDPTGKSGLQEKQVGVHYFTDGNQHNAAATFIARI